MAKNTPLYKKVKYTLLRSILVPEESKRKLLKAMEDFSMNELNELLVVLEESEKNTIKLIQSGFAGKNGQNYYEKLEQLHLKLKRDVRQQHELEDSRKDFFDVEVQLKDI